MSEQAFEILAHSDEREEWLKARHLGIGASEIATICGVGRFGSPLSIYAQKVGALTDDLEGEHLELGLKLEPKVAEIFTERTGREAVRAGELLRSKEHPWAICTPDYWVPPNEVLEIKTVGGRAIAGWSEGVPLYIQYQLQHQLLVTGCASGYVAALTMDPALKFVWAAFGRDEAIIEDIVTNGWSFWQRVKNRNPPAPDESKDSADALKALHFEIHEEEPAVLDFTADEWDYQLLRTKEELSRLEDEKRLLENRIKAAIGDRPSGVTPKGVVFRLTRKEVPAATIERKAYSTMSLYRRGPKPEEEA